MSAPLLEQPIVVVCGLGRCGSTMAMHMLHTGGLDVIADDGDTISYETAATLRLPQEWDWLMSCEGRAIKVLDPHRHQLPPMLPYHFVWMRRNVRQQARSQRRFVRMLSDAGHDIPTPSLSDLIARLKHESHAALKLLAMYPWGVLTVVDFENVLANPAEGAVKIARASGRSDLDLQAMANAVHDRGPRCLAVPWELSQLDDPAVAAYLAQQGEG